MELNLTAVSDVVVQETETLSFFLAAQDPEGDTLTYSHTCTPACPGLSLNASTGEVSWAVPLDASKSYSVEWQVSDGNGNTAQKSSTIDVKFSFSEEWRYRRKYTIDNTMVNETLNEFTLLVSLSPSTFDYAKALPSGADLRFVAADGLTLLSHEIDTWNTSGESLVWVKLPSIAASGTTTSFYLYYGNNAAAPLPLNLARATWKSGTKLVYHFNGQNADGSSGVNSLYEDSTGSNSHAVKRGTVTIVTSRVGNGISTLAGNIDLRGSGPEISHLNNAQTLTAVAWVRTLGPGPSSRHAILCYGSNTSNADNRMCFQIRDDRHRIFSRTDDSTFVEVTADGNSYVTRDVWTLVAYSFSTATGDVKMYTDGQLTFSTTLTLPATQFPSSPSIGASIGSLANGDFQFEGYLDEVRLYEGILSGEWLKAEYLSQNAPASFAVAGAEHVQPD